MVFISHGPELHQGNAKLVLETLDIAKGINEQLQN